MVACCFEYQLVGVVLTNCRVAVTDLPVIASCHRFASRKAVVITGFPNVSGAPLRNSTLSLPQTVLDQSNSCSGRCQ